MQTGVVQARGEGFGGGRLRARFVGVVERGRMDPERQRHGEEDQHCDQALKPGLHRGAWEGTRESNTGMRCCSGLQTDCSEGVASGCAAARFFKEADLRVPR